MRRRSDAPVRSKCALFSRLGLPGSAGRGTIRRCPGGGRPGRVDVERRGFMTTGRTFHPPARLLLGPGPSNVDERVLRAMSAPVIGYFDPAMTEVTGEIQRLLNTAFGTANRATFPVSGTGSAGMEAALINVLEPGDRVAIG